MRVDKFDDAYRSRNFLQHEFGVAHVSSHNSERFFANAVNDDSGGLPLFILSGLNDKDCGGSRLRRRICR
jgi:hypothetical protein